jgi:putative membrane-bound dehydrogenase-like protein
MVQSLVRWVVLQSALLAGIHHATAEQPVFRVGVAKSDITPTEPVRLGGYAARSGNHEGVSDPLSARALVLSPADPNRDVDSVVLVAIDAIGVSSAMTEEVGQWLQAEYRIPRSQLVIASSHSHAAPHLSGLLDNLFPRPTTPEDEAATARYTQTLLAAVKQTIGSAMASRTAAQLHVGDGQVQFPANRRLLNFQVSDSSGTPPVGPLDQRVRGLKITTLDGRLLAGTFLVACHCTTLGSTQLASGDWAGISALRLEQHFPGAIMLPVIGCGADVNPNPRGTYELAEQHAAEVVDAVVQIFAREQLSELNSFPIAQFGFAGLVPENPSRDEVQKVAESSDYHEKFWAKYMLDTFRKMGRLPESYPMPIHTWQFGDQLTWVFLGGEVVTDYQFALEKLLPTEATWVAAYCDDVFAYVASERLRPEGGYEVDRSMIYYLQPGRWESGTQTLIEQRVDEIRQQQRSDDKPLSAEQALAAAHVPEGFRVDMVASEPLISDPINIAFGIDGTVWVVEMADYPLGADGGGRVKWLKDDDGDGRMDRSGVFLDNLSYPSSVIPWRDGVIVISAPDVLYAEDFNGDGVADRRETLLTGIFEANPQHRSSGFEIGLDGWLHFTAGDRTRSLHSLRNNQTYVIHGQDLAWNPDTGEIRFTAGETQFVRGRDEFENWFGNSNSYPMYQYVIDDRYMLGGSVEGGHEHHLLEPAAAPPVLPRSRTVDRFNDQYARNRFTSACSSIIGRVPGLLTSADSAAGVGLICEPVHNLVARIQLNDQGTAFSAVRHPGDVEFDFFTSTDIWSRPVRAVNAPDGTIWIVDMVRRVIEHPEWIPTAWQARLDLRSGENLGRIFRVYRSDYVPGPLGGHDLSDQGLIAMLSSDIGPLRDQAMQHILTSASQHLTEEVRRVARSSPQSTARASALGCLSGMGQLNQEDVRLALAAADKRLVGYALQLAEHFPAPEPALQAALRDVVARKLGSRIDMQWVLTSTRLTSMDSSQQLSDIAARSAGDSWIERALSLVIGEKSAGAAFATLIESLDQSDWEPGILLRWAAVEKLWGRLAEDQRRSALTARLVSLNSRPHIRPGDVVLLRLATADGTLPASSDDLSDVRTRLRLRLTSEEGDELERAGIASLIGTRVFTPDEAIELVQRLLDDDSATVKQTALRQASAVEGESLAGMLLDNWDSFNYREQSLASAALLQRSAWTDALLARLEDSSLSPRQLDPSSLQRLRLHEDPRIRKRAESVLGRPTERAPLVAEYRQALANWRSHAQLDNSAQTDGQQLFREHCAICHQPQDGRSALGPAIENLQHWNDDQWLTAILDPNQAVEPKFQQTIVMTESGRVEAGILLAESSQSLKLARADGQVVEIKKSEVVEAKPQSTSLMPEGFEAKLTAAQIGLIIHYLKQQ